MLFFSFDFAAAAVVREYSSRLRVLLHHAFNAGLAGRFYPCSLPKPSRFLSPFDHCASKEWMILYVSFPVIILVSFGAGSRGATSGALHIRVSHGVVLSALATV